VPSNLRILPPVWAQGDQWRVAMQTEAPVSADLRPSYATHIFDFRVIAIPAAKVPTYKIEARSQDFGSAIFNLYYRQDDFSLEKVTRHELEGSEETIIQNGRHPFIYYERRLPIIPDFPLADLRSGVGRQQFTVAGYQVVQEIRMPISVAQITLQRIEPLGFLRVVMEWAAGDPWWSRIECSENPPPNAPFEGQVVASGYLIKESGQP
jgi:hypothetical protein